MIEKLKAYPKAWADFVFYLINQDTHLFEYDIHEPDKWVEVLKIPHESLSGWLYRFLDEKGIHVDILMRTDLADIERPLVFGAKIWYVKFEWQIQDLGKFDSRPEAEEAAFIKAFEILEERNA